MIFELLLLALSGLLLIFWKDNFNIGKRIPGPLRLPIIGNLGQAFLTNATLPQVQLDRLARKYGSIFNFKLGMKEMVVLSSYEDMKYLLVQDEFSGRGYPELQAARGFHPDLGIVLSSGQIQQTIRKFTVRNLRDFGFGKQASMESMIKNELEIIVENLKSKCTKGVVKVSMSSFFNLSLINVLWGMLTGKRYSHDDPRLLHLLELNELFFKAANFGTSIIAAFPFIGDMFPKVTGVETLGRIGKPLRKLMQEILDEHRQEDNLDNPQTFVDVFINQIDKDAKEFEKTGQIPTFTDDQFIVAGIDLFQVGSGTMTGFIEYAFLFMILHPEIQVKVQKEIDEVFPDGNPVEISGKESMIYTQATICEVLRLGCIVPIIPTRRVMGNFKYKGLHFEKGLEIVPNLYAIFMDESYWGDPETFRPERFINNEGKLYNTERLCAFGFGKRICMGESLAVACDFMYFTTILKNFNLKRDIGQPEPKIEPIPALTTTPPPYDAIFTIRHQNGLKF